MELFTVTNSVFFHIGGEMAQVKTGIVCIAHGNSDFKKEAITKICINVELPISIILKIIIP